MSYVNEFGTGGRGHVVFEGWASKGRRKRRLRLDHMGLAQRVRRRHEGAGDNARLQNIEMPFNGKRALVGGFGMIIKA